MPIVEPLEVEEPDPTQPSLVVTTDLRSDGTFGEAHLELANGSVIVTENGEARLEVPLADLTDPEVEPLVDSSALIVHRNGTKIELLRGSNRCTTTLFSLQKKLEGLLSGDGALIEIETPRVCEKCGRPLPEDSDKCDACVHRGKTLMRVLGYLKPYKKAVLGSAALMIVAAALETLPPYLTKILIDDVLKPGTNVGLFWTLILLLIGARIVSMLVTIVRARVSTRIGHFAVYDLRSSLFHHLQELSISFFDKRQVGSIMSRITQDTGALLDLYVDAIPALLANGLLIIAIATGLLIMKWHVALLTLLPAPFIFLIVRMCHQRIRRVWRHFWHRWSKLSGALSGTLSGMRVVKAFAGEAREDARFDRRIAELRDAGARADWMWANLSPVIQFLVHSSALIVWVVAGRQVLDGKMTLGELVAFLGYLALFYGPLQQLTRWIDWTTRSLSAAERIFEIIDTQPDIRNSGDVVQMPDIQGNVRFENVTFGYDKLRMVLKGINLEVKAGEMIGLVGTSGAGKTTFTNLLTRFYDPNEGRILIDGVDMKRIDLDDLRRQTALVLQDSFLFPTSLRENILYGRARATDEEIMNAAKAANAHDFIMKFPDAYDSYVGERGQKLSGGERQRIAIARALLRNPRILVLDEATSSVDSETESDIQEALNRLIAGRTTFVIAHRLSTLRHADRIVVLEDGEIVEIGTHDELMKIAGVYSRLVDKQQQMNMAHVV